MAHFRPFSLGIVRHASPQPSLDFLPAASVSPNGLLREFSRLAGCAATDSFWFAGRRELCLGAHRPRLVWATRCCRPTTTSWRRD